MNLQLPPDFTAILGTRPVSLQAGGVKVSASATAIELRYKGVTIALFISEANSEVDLPQRVREHVATFGYLAEWTRQKLVTGVQPNWDESMRVATEPLKRCGPC